jgi:hypothetical protein
MIKRKWVTWTFILTAILIAVIFIKRPIPETPEEVTKCIGENSVLYTQLGCHACEIQEKMFGDNYQYLNVVDCFPYVPGKCDDIRATPTWIINGEHYIGVQNIETLQELTGCE